MLEIEKLPQGGWDDICMWRRGDLFSHGVLQVRHFWWFVDGLLLRVCDGGSRTLYLIFTALQHLYLLLCQPPTLRVVQRLCSAVAEARHSHTGAHSPLSPQGNPRVETLSLSLRSTFLWRAVWGKTNNHSYPLQCFSQWFDEISLGTWTSTKALSSVGNSLSVFHGLLDHNWEALKPLQSPQPRTELYQPLLWQAGG